METQRLVPVYPFEGTFVPLIQPVSAGPHRLRKQEAAKLFREFLLKPEMQTVAVANGMP